MVRLGLLLRDRSTSHRQMSRHASRQELRKKALTGWRTVPHKRTLCLRKIARRDNCNEILWTIAQKSSGWLHRNPEKNCMEIYWKIAQKSSSPSGHARMVLSGTELSIGSKMAQNCAKWSLQSKTALISPNSPKPEISERCPFLRHPVDWASIAQRSWPSKATKFWEVYHWLRPS